MVKQNRILNFMIKNKLLIVIFLLGILARVLFFGDFPPGFSKDEASAAYESYALLNYGIDRNGYHNPVHLIAYGSGQNALQSYMQMPFIALFGLTPISARLPSLILGIISLFAFYLLVKEIFNKKIATLALFLLAINPWHIMISRWSLEANIFPPIVLFGILFFVLSFRKQIYLPISFVFFALALYAYGPAYFFIPSFLFIATIYLLFHKKIKWKVFIPSVLLFLIISLPIFLFVGINVYKLDSIETSFLSIPKITAKESRIEEMASFLSGNFFRQIFRNAKIFAKILIYQKDTTPYNHVPGFGFLYLFSMPLVLIGLYLVSRKNISKKFDKSFVILLWLLLAVLIGILVKANLNRINVIFLPLILLCALGLAALKYKKLIALVLLVYLVSFGFFAYSYFLVHPPKIAAEHNKSLGNAVVYAAASTDGEICFDFKKKAPYLYALFFTKADPNVFINTAEYRRYAGIPPSRQLFKKVKFFGRYYFAECRDIESINVFIVPNKSVGKYDNTIFTKKTFEYFTVFSR